MSNKQVVDPPPGWEALGCAEDWRYLAGYLDEEPLHGLAMLLNELGGATPGFGAKLTAEIRDIRTLLPDLPPGHVLMLALPRAACGIDRGARPV